MELPIAEFKKPVKLGVYKSPTYDLRNIHTGECLFNLPAIKVGSIIKLNSKKINDKADIGDWISVNGWQVKYHDGLDKFTPIDECIHTTIAIELFEKNIKASFNSGSGVITDIIEFHNTFNGEVIDCTIDELVERYSFPLPIIRSVIYYSEALGICIPCKRCFLRIKGSDSIIPNKEWATLLSKYDYNAKFAGTFKGSKSYATDHDIYLHEQRKEKNRILERSKYTGKTKVGGEVYKSKANNKDILDDASRGRGAVGGLCEFLYGGKLQK